jgi:hypothetical protein
MENKQPKYLYKGIPCDSEEEIMMLYVLFDLQELGFIEKIQRSPTFLLSESVKIQYEEKQQLKTKVKINSKKITLLEEHVYTPEFKVVWNKKILTDLPNLIYVTNFESENVNEKFKFIKDKSSFFANLLNDELISYFEIKPSYDRHNMTRLFIINRKWVHEKLKIITNFIEPYAWYEKNYVPEKWLFTDTGRQRKINFEVKNINHYIKKLKND